MYRRILRGAERAIAIQDSIQEQRDMRDTDAVKWALVDLLKLLDVIHGGEYHAEFLRIARALGVELPVPPDTEEEVEV